MNVAAMVAALWLSCPTTLPPPQVKIGTVKVGSHKAAYAWNGDLRVILVDPRRIPKTQMRAVLRHEVAHACAHVTTGDPLLGERNLGWKASGLPDPTNPGGPR